MQLKTLEALRKSELVEEIVSVDFDAVGGSYRLKARARLRNDWLMDVWEHVAPRLRRYSYHIFYRNRMIVRWVMRPISQALKPSHTTNMWTKTLKSLQK